VKDLPRKLVNKILLKKILFILLPILDQSVILILHLINFNFIK